VVLTGAQQPLGAASGTEQAAQPTDAVDNVTSALRFCRALGDAAGGQTLLSCVFLAFDGLLLRGNCARKVDSSRMRAFQSPNLPPVGHLLEGQVIFESS